MKKIFSLFKIQKEERLLVLFFLVVLVAFKWFSDQSLL